MIEFFSEPPFKFEPGQKFDYSNRGYILLGMIIGKVANMSYADYVERGA